MRLIRLIIVLGLFCAAAAEQTASDAQISAATADAISSLQRQILATSINPDLTAGDLLRQIGGTDQLRQALGGAQRIGGSRWLDDQTVQVQLTIGGGKVADALLKIAQDHPRNLPLSIDRLARQLHSWHDRSFSATGTSTSAANVERLHPSPANRNWQAVNDAERRRTLLAARDSAIDHVLDSLRPITFDSDKTLDQALAVPQVRDSLRQWLSARPISSVQFASDLSVTLTLSDDPHELWQTLKTALSQQKQLPFAMPQDSWDRLEEQVTARVAAAVGTAVAQPPATAPRTAIALPAGPPAWATRQAEAEATAVAHPTRLRTARAAEAVAVENLRHEIEALPLTDKLTIGQAAQRDPSVAQAVSRALARARPYKVDYLAKGAVTVHVALNLSDLWAELNNED